MPQALLEIIASTAPFESLPLMIEQRSSKASGVIMLLLLAPALGLLFFPAALLAASVPWDVTGLAGNPLASLQVLLGLALSTALFAVPAKRIIQRFGSSRSVRIDTTSVIVRDEGLFGSRLWMAPLGEFRGVAHHVRATLSGLRHELVLVHPDRKKCVLLHTADTMTAASVQQAAALLRLPEISARALYERRLRDRPAAAAPMGGAQAA